MKKRKGFTFSKRPVLIFSLFCAVLAGVTGRLANLTAGQNGIASADTTQRSVTVGRSRGYIYDRNLRPLVNDGEKNTAAIIINDKTRQFINNEIIKGQSLSTSGVIVTFESDEKIEETLFSTNVRTVVRYSKQALCGHIIGYTDGEGRGVCGIEKSFDRLLSAAEGSVGVKYSSNAGGEAIAGTGLQVTNDGYDDPSGIVLTIDKDIQIIVEDSLKKSGITTGAAIVLKVGTGEIMALASLPCFDRNNLKASLNDDSLPFLNRALSAYPVGSVFKPFIAAAAIENDISPPNDFYCSGKTEVGELVFRCFNSAVHGQLDLNKAICRSCNSYFISLGQETGAKSICDICSRMGFGKETVLTGDIKASAGVLPDEESLSSPGALANLCFGQGELLETPLQLAAAFNCLASGGEYSSPYITKALVNEKKQEYAYYKNDEPVEILKDSTTEIINEALNLNMTEGTGKPGSSEFFSSAGKTATAQTGKYEADGKEKLCTWFCGFFPYDFPEYTVAVFCENGTSAAEDCAPVFKSISEGIYFAGLNG
ncbi:MAG: penicillin-binding protein 2 [Clostridia bacterium]|nr:penicillin-binding protein 2 [Clostridia bacterium]